jgi:uncharacterized repeat protein (TIGR01451 family)
MALLSPVRIALSVLLLAASTAQARPLDVTLDDRVDPAPIGGELVYEIGVKVIGESAAPDVVVTLHLPPGTSFVSARRQPDYAPIAGQVSGQDVTFDLGDVVPCNKKDLPACRDIWALVHVSNAVDAGTVMQASADVASSAPGAFAPDSHVVYTSAGSLAIRKARVNFASVPGRDRVQFTADVGRNGWPAPTLPPTPTFDVSSGVRVRLGEAGEPPVLDVTVPGDAFRCNGVASRRCRLARPKDWRALGLDRLNVFLPHDFLQRNNASVIVRTAALAVPPDLGPEMQLTLDAAGETYTDTALLKAKGRRLVYTHTQAKP